MATRSSFRVTVRNDRSAAVSAALIAKAKEAVDDSAADLQNRAYQIAPFDTGALRNSIYVNNGDDSDYADRVGFAENLNPLMTALDRIDPEFVISLAEQADGAYYVVVGVAAHYGIFQEFGTVFQPPQSFLLPVAEAVRDDFRERMSQIANDV